MKKSVVAGFILTLTVGLLAACGNQKNAESDPAESNAEDKKESAVVQMTEESASEEGTVESSTMEIDESDVTIREKYHLELHADDPIDVLYTDKFIRVKYVLQNPELNPESYYDEIEGEYVLTDDFNPCRTFWSVWKA